MTAAATHSVQIAGDVVVKRFRSWRQDEPAREWRALTLLAEHAPGLAPRPIRADLAARPPTVIMSRLTGIPLGAHPMTSPELTALAGAITRLHTAVQPALLTVLPPRRWHPAEVLATVRQRCASPPDLGPDQRVREAFAAVASWVTRPSLGTIVTARARPVLGQADGNLANYLWNPADGRVRVVDFEDSGTSDALFELAEIIEHVSAWATRALDAPALLAHFQLTAADTARMRELRRLLGSWWLLTLLLGGPAQARNPPGTLERHASRLLALLG